jgi:hypothetical protein
MRIATRKSKHQGSVLLITLMTAWVIGIALVSYLTLVANQNRRTYHSLTWTTCIPVLEAGIEEALTQIKYTGIDNLGANQWSFNASDQLYHKTRPINNDGSYYDVAIQPIDPRGEPNGPVIFSTGYVLAPAGTGAPLGGDTAFGMILGTVSGSLSQSSPVFVSRTVRVTTIRQGQSPGGLNARGHIIFSGGAYFDSFDSTDPNGSSNGKYDPARRKANAKAVTNLGTGAAINVGGGRIYGSVSTGPDGIVTVGSGAVGDLAFIPSSTEKIQQGHERNDANLEFDDVQAPFTYGSGLTPVTGTALLGGLLNTYTWLLDSGNYQLGSVSISGGRTMLVTGNATLYVNGNFSTSGNGGLVIAPGASLKLYIAGTGSFSGNGIVNNAGLARSLSIYGLNSCRSIAYSGISEFIGTVYAPHADFRFSGASGAFGAFTGETINVSGGAHVAYDEDLRNTGDFVMESWNEI